MSPQSRLRRLPPVCALVAVLHGLVGRLGFERRYVGSELVMEDGRRFRVFRHLAARETGAGADGSTAVFVARFRFVSLPEHLNRWLSLIPVPLIGGYPGFRHKLWMADAESYWQGVYEWESAEALAAYRGSFVLRLMNRRADPKSISYAVMERTCLADFVDRRAENPRRPAGRQRAVVHAEEAARRRYPGGAR